jgi:F420-dependent oxidoreductase-like protein
VALYEVPQRKDLVRISLFSGADATSVGQVTERVQAAAEYGFACIWFAQGFNLDAPTAIAVAGSKVPGIDIGTAVVPIQGRHPLPLAIQALTVASAVGPGRFTLGIGVTHKMVSEGMFGVPYKSVVDLCAEELSVLSPLLGADRKVTFEGPTMTARASIGTDSQSPGLVVAALGPRMLDLAGRYSDGTVTWMTGAATLRRDVVPRIVEAAGQAGRPDPRVIAGLPVCVTDDVAGARDRIGAAMAGPASMASYRRMLDAEGVSDPVDIAILGGEDEVVSQIRAISESGATELLANVMGTHDEQLRTRSFLGRLAGL